MRSLVKVAFSLLILAFVLIGVSYGMLRAQGVSAGARPEGRTVDSETRALRGAVTTVDVTGPIDLQLRYGPVPALTIRGEQRLLSNIESVQQGGTLHIGTTGMLLHHRRPLQAVLVLPALERLNVNGSGDSSISGLSGDSVTLMLDGSGTTRFNGRYRSVHAVLHGSGRLDLNVGSSDDVALELEGSGTILALGTARSLVARTSGSGELDARHLRADDVRLRQDGSGENSVLARSSVAVTIAGSGDANVRGNPTHRQVARTGSGDAIFRDE